MECQCDKCKDACEYTPGWFMPGEAEKAAIHVGKSLQTFFDEFLGVNWWEGDVPIFALAPALVGEEAGTEYPGDPRGTCVFFKDGLCDIHVVKPHECAESSCLDTIAIEKRHRKVVDAWKGHQNKIIELLGREPETMPYVDSFFGW